MTRSIAPSSALGKKILERFKRVRPSLDATADEAREHAARLLAEKFWSWKPIPEGDQKVFIRDTAPGRIKPMIYVLLGGNRSGKTESGAYSFARYVRVVLGPIARARAARGDVTTVWVVGPTFELVAETTWKRKLAGFFPPSDIVKVSWDSEAKQWPRMIRLASGVEMVFKSGDQSRTAFQGTDIFMAWIDEQIPDDVLEEIRWRLLDRAAPMLMTQTPLEPDPAMQRRWEERPEGWKFYQTDMEDNRKSRGGHLPDEMVDKALAELKEENPDLYDTRKSGIFAAFQGAIFKTFSPKRHVRPDDELLGLVSARRDHLEFLGGVDFGATNPFCFVLAARDTEGTWYILGEHYEQGATIERNASKMISLMTAWDVKKLRSLYCDPGDQSATALGEQYKVAGRSTLARLGFPVVTAAKNWWPSCEAVMKVLARSVAADGRGRIVFGEPKLYIAAGCRNLIRQMQTYRHAKGTENRDPKDAGPVKKDDHAVDALRYLIFSRDRSEGAGLPEAVVGAERKFAASSSDIRTR